VGRRERREFIEIGGRFLYAYNVVNGGVGGIK
jgi:hypothetical protein